MLASLQLGITSGGGITVGLRVVKDWHSEEHDGENFVFVGTIVEIRSQRGTVLVIWDGGEPVEYGSGLEGKDDLRVLDNAPAGLFCVFSVSVQDSKCLFISK